jgi:hypothetical protein
MGTRRAGGRPVPLSMRRDGDAGGPPFLKTGLLQLARERVPRRGPTQAGPREPITALAPP